MSDPIILRVLNVCLAQVASRWIVAKLASQYYNALITRAANAGSLEEADVLMKEAMIQQSEAVAGMIEAGIIDPRFHRVMQAMITSLDQDVDSGSDSSDDEFNGEEHEEEDEEEEAAKDEESVVPARPNIRRYPEPALVEIEIGVAMSLAPFDLTEPVWTGQLALILRSRGIAPESMEGLQNLLLDMFSRSRAQGVVVLAEQWRRTKQYSDALESCHERTSCSGQHVPAFTRKMVISLKAEAAEGVSGVFNLIEHVGLATKLAKAFTTMSNRQGETTRPIRHGAANKDNAAVVADHTSRFANSSSKRP